MVDDVLVWGGFVWISLWLIWVLGCLMWLKVMR